MAEVIRALAKFPGHCWFECYIPNTLESLQTFVRGHIETVTFGGCLAVICSEEGRLLDLPHNCYVDGVDFCGPVLLCGVSGDEFCSVSDDDVKEHLPGTWLDIVGGEV